MSKAVPLDDAAALIRYIEERCHGRHRTRLPPLVAMEELVVDLHPGDADVPGGGADLLRRMIGETELYMTKDELIRFPAICKGGVPGIENPMVVMRADRDDHDREVQEFRCLRRAPSLPEGACTIWKTLHEGLSELSGDLTEHIWIENDPLSPQFEPEGQAHV